MKQEVKDKLKQKGYEILNRKIANRIYIECLKGWKTKKELSDIIRGKTHPRKKPSSDIADICDLLLNMGYLETMKIKGKEYTERKKKKIKEKYQHKLPHYKSNFEPFYQYIEKEKISGNLTDIGKRIFDLLFAFIDFNEEIPSKMDYKIINDFPNIYNSIREELVIKEFERIKEREFLAYLTRTDISLYVPEMNKISLSYRMITGKNPFIKDLLHNYLSNGKDMEKLIERTKDVWEILNSKKETFERFDNEMLSKFSKDERKKFSSYSSYKKIFEDIKKKYSDNKLYFLMDIFADDEPIVFFNFSSIFLTKLEKTLLSDKIKEIIANKILPLKKEERLKDYFYRIRNEDLIHILQTIKQHNSNLKEEEIKEEYLKKCIKKIEEPILITYYLLFAITGDKKYKKSGDIELKEITEKFMRIGKERIEHIYI